MNRDAKLRAMKRITAELVRIGGRISWVGSLNGDDAAAEKAYCRKRIRACRERLESLL